MFFFHPFQISVLTIHHTPCTLPNIQYHTLPHSTTEYHHYQLTAYCHLCIQDEKFYEKKEGRRKGNYSTKEDLLRFDHLFSDENSEEEEKDEEENRE